MTNTTLKNKVTEAVSLDREIAESTERLKALKAELITEAQSRREEHTRTDGGGSSWTFEGADGCVCRVTLPAPKLRGSIRPGKALDKIQQLAGRFFPRLFEQAPAYVPVQDFRAHAAELMGKDARRLISACESKSSPTVSFETKEAQ